MVYRCTIAPPPPPRIWTTVFLSGIISRRLQARWIRERKLFLRADVVVVQYAGAFLARPDILLRGRTRLYFCEGDGALFQLRSEFQCKSRFAASVFFLEEKNTIEEEKVSNRAAGCSGYFTSVLLTISQVIVLLGDLAECSAAATLQSKTLFRVARPSLRP